MSLQDAPLVTSSCPLPVTERPVCVFQVLSHLQAAPAGHEEAGPVVSAAGAGGPSQALLLQPLHEGQAGLAGGLPAAVRHEFKHVLYGSV